MFMLSTSRLLLRDFEPDDWHTIYALSQTPQVTHFQSWLRLSSGAQAQQWVANAIMHNQLLPRLAYNLLVLQHHNQQPIGWLGWGQDDGQPILYQFGYALLPIAWGQGFMTEALDAAIMFMFDVLGAERIQGECECANLASARVMEKVGLTRIAQWHELDPHTNQVVERCQYQSEYRSQQVLRGG